MQHRAPTRFYSRVVEFTFWQAIKNFLKHGEWSWTKCVFDPVYKGDPKYDAAPFEESILWKDDSSGIDVIWKQ